MDHRVRLRHLRHFLEIARQKSLTRAAEALNTVQPSLSRSLAELESELGKTLFHRTPQGMVLTPEGTAFYHTVAGPLAMINEGIASARGRPVRQVVRIALAPAITRLLGIHAIADFCTAFPDVHVIVEARMYTEAVHRLRDGGVDFAVGRLLDPNALRGLSYEQLFSEPIVFSAHRDHPLAGRTGLTMDDLDPYLIVGPENNAIIWAEIEKFLIKHGRQQFRRVLESSSYDFSRTFLYHSDAIACLSRSIVRNELDSGDFVELDIPVDEMIGSVGITYRTGARMSPPVRALFDLFRAKARLLYA
ncbi:MAG: LysR family transcriptional regulator [Rhodobacteraceae bacterium]|nr:LysR family transcriptional regulator [Paracoccaceae bacterium]